jgi:response regulator RpfG family c-di-GMP phosphodiesterase
MDVFISLQIAGIVASLAVFFAVLKNAHATAPARNALFSRLIHFAIPSKPAVERVCGVSTNASSITLLAVSQDRACQERLKNLAELYDWNLYLCPTCESAAALPDTVRIPIVLFDRDGLDMNWRDAFRLFLAADRSRCVVLCSPFDDNHLWQEVIRLGGYDIVRKPFREEQIVRTIQFAWAFWKTVHTGRAISAPIPS